MRGLREKVGERKRRRRGRRERERERGRGGERRGEERRGERERERERERRRRERGERKKKTDIVPSNCPSIFEVNVELNHYTNKIKKKKFFTPSVASMYEGRIS